MAAIAKAGQKGAALCEAGREKGKREPGIQMARMIGNPPPPPPLPPPASWALGAVYAVSEVTAGAAGNSQIDPHGRSLIGPSSPRRHLIILPRLPLTSLPHIYLLPPAFRVCRPCFSFILPLLSNSSPLPQSLSQAKRIKLYSPHSHPPDSRQSTCFTTSPQHVGSNLCTWPGFDVFSHLVSALSM